MFGVESSVHTTCNILLVRREYDNFVAPQKFFRFPNSDGFLADKSGKTSACHELLWLFISDHLTLEGCRISLVSWSGV